MSYPCWHIPAHRRLDDRRRRGADHALGDRGATIWLTGLPAAGKSTVAAAVERRLLAEGRAACLLDGDSLRHGLNRDLGFDRAGRRENVRRAAHLARVLAEAGIVAVAGLVSPYAHDRRAAADLHHVHGLAFLEVYVATPLRECERRDPKRLYERARRGELVGMTGVDDPYEPPTAADVVVSPGSEATGAAVDRILAALARRETV